MAEHALKNGRIIEVYRPRAADAPEMMKYLKTVGGETDFLLMTADGLSITVEQEAEFLELMFLGERSAMFAGRIDGEIAMVCNFNARKHERTKHTANIGLSVKKKFWHIGVGGVIMRTFFEHARLVGVEIIDLEVNANNTRAIALYERFGFEKVGCHHKHLHINGEYIDEIIMEKHLEKNE